MASSWWHYAAPREISRSGSDFGYDGPSSFWPEGLARDSSSSFPQSPSGSKIRPLNIFKQWKRKTATDTPEESQDQSLAEDVGTPAWKAAREHGDGEILNVDDFGGRMSTKKSVDLVSCPDLGRSSHDTDLGDHHRGSLMIRESTRNYTSTSARANPYRRPSRARRLYRSNSVATAAPTSDALRIQGRERRRMNRVSCEIVSESAAGNPLFNTPTSESLPGSHLIAIAGMMIAISQLDRLSAMANDRLGIPVTKQSISTSPVIKSITKAPANTPITMSGLSSISPTVPSTPFVPPNSPMTSEDTPASHATYQNKPARAKRANSRLSGVQSLQPQNTYQHSNSEYISPFLGLRRTEIPSTPPSPVTHPEEAHRVIGTNSSSAPASESKVPGHSLCELLPSQDLAREGPHSPVLGSSSTLYQRRGVKLDALPVSSSVKPKPWDEFWEAEHDWEATPGAESTHTVQHHEVVYQSETSSLSQGEPDDDEVLWLDTQDGDEQRNK